MTTGAAAGLDDCAGAWPCIWCADGPDDADGATACAGAAFDATTVGTETLDGCAVDAGARLDVVESAGAWAAPEVCGVAVGVLEAMG
jgi:hypothetical protein